MVMELLLSRSLKMVVRFLVSFWIDPFCMRPPMRIIEDGLICSVASLEGL